MIEEQSLLFSLGLAQKAGKTASGDFAVRSAIKNGKVKLLLLAADAAENSKKDLVKNNMLQCDCSINYSEFPINVVIFQALLSALISKDYWMNAVIAIS